MLQVDEAASCAEVSEVAEDPLVPAFGLIGVPFMLRLEGLHGIEDRLSGLPGEPVFHLRQFAGGPLEITGLQGQAHPLAVFRRPTRPDEAAASALEEIW